MNKLTKIARLLEIKYKLAEEAPENMAWLVNLQGMLQRELDKFATLPQYVKPYGVQELTVHIKPVGDRGKINVGGAELGMLDKPTRLAFRQDVQNVVDAVVYRMGDGARMNFGGYDLMIF